MPLFVLADIILGACAIAGWLYLRHVASRHPGGDPDSEVIRADLAASLRAWGTAVVLLGLLAYAQMPGGFTLAIWSLLALGAGSLGALLVGLRWRAEGWHVGAPGSGLFRVESETWQFALIGGVVGLASTYVLGLALNIMQPVHLGISLLEGTVGYALGLIIWTPQTKLHRVAPPVERTDEARPVVVRQASLRQRRRRSHSQPAGRERDSER